MKFCVALPDDGVIVWRSGVKLKREAAGEMLNCLHSLAEPPVITYPFLSIDPVEGEKALQAAMREMGWL